MKVAVAGLGWWGKQIISCLEKSPRFEVLYGVDPSPPDDVAAFRQQHPFPLEADLDTVLADAAVEGVILATPHALHEEQALRIIAAGKQLFCEKPLTMTAEGAQRVVDACQKAGKVWASVTNAVSSRPSRSCSGWSTRERSASFSSSRRISATTSSAGSTPPTGGLAPLTRQPA